MMQAEHIAFCWHAGWYWSKEYELVPNQILWLEGMHGNRNARLENGSKKQVCESDIRRPWTKTMISWKNHQTLIWKTPPEKKSLWRSSPYRRSLLSFKSTLWLINKKWLGHDLKSHRTQWCNGGATPNIIWNRTECAKFWGSRDYLWGILTTDH